MLKNTGYRSEQPQISHHPTIDIIRISFTAKKYTLGCKKCIRMCTRQKYLGPLIAQSPLGDLRRSSCPVGSFKPEDHLHGRRTPLPRSNISSPPRPPCRKTCKITEEKASVRRGHEGVARERLTKKGPGRRCRCWVGKCRHSQSVSVTLGPDLDYKDQELPYFRTIPTIFVWRREARRDKADRMPEEKDD